MADEQVSLVITLDGKQVAVGADDAAAALERLRVTFHKDTQELNAMKRAMSALQKGNKVDIATYRDLKAKIEAKNNAIAESQQAYIQLGGKLTEMTKKSGGLKSALQEITKEAQQMPGPIGAAASAWQRLAGFMGGSGRAAAILGVAAAVGIVTAKVIQYTRALYGQAVAAAEARRNEALMLQGLTTVRNLYGIAAGKAEDLTKAIDNVSASSSLARGKVTDLAQQLYRAGFRGANLESALGAMATKTAVQGEEQANLWMGFARAVALGGGSVDRMAARVQQRLGGVVKKQLLSSAVQAEKLKESYDTLFRDISIEKLLAAKKNFNDMFSQATNSGKALRQILGLVLQPLVDAQAKTFPVMKRFFQGMIIAAQQFVIAILDVAIWVKETFGIKFPQSMDLSKAAILAGKAAFWTLAAVIATASVLTVGLAVKLTGFLVPALAKAGLASVRFAWSGLAAIAKLIPAFGTLAVQVLAATWPILLAAAALYGLYKIGELLYTVWKEIDWTDLGRSIWKGIVNGLTAGWAAVKNATTMLAQKAKDAFTDLLGIHSPSKVFQEYGLNVGQGLSEGLKASQPSVDQQVSHMIDVPDAASSGAAQGGGARSVVVNLGGITINGMQGGGQEEQAKSLAETIRKHLESILTDSAMELGAAV